jgi:hypothetical protein
MAKGMLANSEELRCNFSAATQTASIGIDRVHGDCALSAGVLRRHTDCSADLFRESQCAPTLFERVSRVRMEAWRIRNEH